MRLLDEQYTRTPFYGSRKMTAWLHTQGYTVDRKRVRRLLHLMGLDPRKLEVPGRRRLDIDYGKPIVEILA